MAEIKSLKVSGQSYDIYAVSAALAEEAQRVAESAISSVNITAVTGVEGSAIASQIPESAISSIPATAITGIEVNSWSSISGLTGAIDENATSGFAAGSAVATAIAGASSALDEKIEELSGYFTEGSANAALSVPYSAISGYGITETLSADKDSEKGGLVQASAIEKALANIVETVDGIGAYQVTATVPAAADADTKHIYLVGPIASVTGDDKYEEYIKSGDEMVKIGETTMDLTGYVKRDEEAYVTLSGYAHDWNDTKTAMVTTSAGMTGEGAGEKIADVAAITGYVDAKIDETIAETIDIASAISSTTPASAIPNVGALTGYVNDTVTAVSTSASLWNQTYDVVTAASGDWNDAYGAVTGAVADSTAMSGADNTEKLAQVGAITGYVDAKVAALSGDYIEKADIYVSGTELVIDNL